MNSLRYKLLSPNARTVVFFIGWVILALFMVLCLCGAELKLLAGTGVIGLAFLVTANSLAVRASLWRSQANLTATKTSLSAASDEVVDLLVRNTESVDKLIAGQGRSQRGVASSRDVVSSNFGAFSTFTPDVTDARTVFPDEPYLANYLNALSGVSKGPILVVGAFGAQDNDLIRKRLQSLATDLGIGVEIVSSVEKNSPVWDVRSYKHIAILPHEDKPASLIPFSWVESRAQIHVLARHVRDGYLRALNYGTEVEFAYLPGSKFGVEVKVRRNLA